MKLVKTQRLQGYGGKGVGMTDKMMKRDREMKG